MIRKNKFFKLNILAMLIVSFLAVAVYGQETASKPVAEEMMGASGISWAPRVSYSQLGLTISRPDGTVFSTTFESGKTPYVDLGSILGSSYADGSYTYELRVIPSDVQKFSREREFKTTRGEGMRSHKALTQTGYFFVRGGAIETPNEPEASAHEPVRTGNVNTDTSQEGLSRTSDVCYADDLIVDGSFCVGFDCTCNYSFGFDTIVLKENNLRIFFDDTSSTGSFPSNDWRIVINDSANGGASYFGVEDSTAGRRVFTLEAGAPAHSIYVDDGGRVGFGTSTPVVDLHVKSGNTPALRLDQDGSSGFSPQVWDVAGNETSFFIRDATNGSTLPFRVFPSAPSNSLVIEGSTGDVGVGTTSPDYAFEVERNSDNAEIVATRVGGAQNLMNATSSFAVFGAINDFSLRLVTNNSWRMQLNTDNSLSMRSGATCTTGGVWTDNSSRELKENIRGLSTDEALETLSGLNPVKYNYKAEKGEEYLGFIAEDVPELVAMKDRKHMTPMDVVAVLTKVVQEQQKSIKDQQKLAQEQQETISHLKKKIADLEKSLH